MSLRCLLLAFVFALKFGARADEAPPTFPEPDHLVPVDPYPGDFHVRYTDQLRSRLKLDPFFFARMVVRPSFSFEYAVRLHGAKGDNEIDRAAKFFLTYSAADKTIWYSMPENRLGQKDKRQQKVKITEKTGEFPKPLATRVMQLFQRMIQQTSYGVGEEGADGTTYEFGIGRAYGETWSPRERKSPLLFVELGESLKLIL